jgi:hypothetical protein
MSRNAALTLVALLAVLIVLLVTVNVTRCETFSGPFGFLRFTACEEEPLLNPSE